MKSLMMGEGNIFKVKVRGSQEGIAVFGKALGAVFKIVSTEDEEGQQTIVFKGTEDGGKVFALASEAGIQVRDYGPATLSLEDIFISAFKEGA